jgi:hypothetical protein
MDIVPIEHIASKIYLIRFRKVMLDRDLAEVYGVETKQLKRAVRRNISRFPKDFMFELTMDELENLRCRIGASSWGVRGTVFEVQGFEFGAFSSLQTADCHSEKICVICVICG